jgi:hypothetical protein
MLKSQQIGWRPGHALKRRGLGRLRRIPVIAIASSDYSDSQIAQRKCLAG